MQPRLLVVVNIELKQANALVEVCDLTIGYPHVNQGILLANLLQLGVLFDVKHLVEELKRLVVCFGVLYTLVLEELFVVVRVETFRSTSCLVRDERLLLDQTYRLFVAHHID